MQTTKNEKTTMKNNNKNTFISSHDGIFVKSRGKTVSEGIRNSYEIWKDEEENYFVKMKLLESGNEVHTLFDLDCLEKIKKNNKIWYSSQGYVVQSGNQMRMHNLIMDFTPNGGFPQNTIDHINRIRFDNRRSNLRIATMSEQLANQKGKIEGTKRERQCIAINLPDGINQTDIPKYVNFRKELYKEYFVIDEHPLYLNNITINSKNLKKHIKSVQSQWEDQYAEPKIPYSIQKKLEEIKIKVVKLNELYDKWLKDKNTTNILSDDPIVISFTEETRDPKNTKKVYKYDKDNNFIEEYHSIVEAAKNNNCSEKTISRVIKNNNLYKGYYYKTKIRELDQSILGQVNA